MGEPLQLPSASYLLRRRSSGLVGTGPSQQRHALLHLDRKTKLDLVDRATLRSLDWQEITPNAEGDWINQRDERFPSFQPLSMKDGRDAIFASNGAGLQTNRDAWVYNSSSEHLISNVTRMIDNYNGEVALSRPLHSVRTFCESSVSI